MMRLNDDTERGETTMSTKNTAVPADDEIEDLEVEETEELEEEAETFTAKNLASELGIEPKAFRRWLRNYTKERANKGGRWVFSADRKAELLAAYAADHSAPAEDSDEE